MLYSLDLKTGLLFIFINVPDESSKLCRKLFILPLFVYVFSQDASVQLNCIKNANYSDFIG